MKICSKEIWSACVWVWGVSGVKQGSIGSLELPDIKGLQSQPLALRMWLPDSLMYGQTGKFTTIQPKLFYGLPAHPLTLSN